MERKLTKEEYSKFVNLYNSIYPNEFWFWGIVFCLLSIVIYSILFLVVYFADKKTIFDAATFSLLGPGLILIIFISNILINYKKTNSEKAKWKMDLRERSLKIENISVTSAWQVIDKGYNQKPDLLLGTIGNRFICIPRENIDQGPLEKIKSQAVLYKLKNTNFLIKVDFLGNDIFIGDRIIEAKDEWRNNDLQYYQLYSLNDLSVNLKNQLKI